MIKHLLLLLFLSSAVLAADGTGASRSKAAGLPSLLVLGDSLSAGYGMRVESGWVALLEERLAQAGHDYHVINASISGETTHGALNRLDSLLEREDPDIVIIELGGNDGLRGIQPAVMKENLNNIIEQLRSEGANVVLVPMRMPPNYGPAFSKKFETVYAELAEEHDIVLSRFILDDIALQSSLMQSDGIHPTAKAQTIMLDNIWPAIKQVLPGPVEQASQP